MKVVESSPWKYTLYEAEDDRLVLSVVCGGVGLYEVRVPLTPADVEAYRLSGAAYLDNLCAEVAKDPKRFDDRIT